MMLQQTPVDRVIPKYEVFIKRYPTVQKLAKASLADVLKLWQGLGYNRRAKLLLLCAQLITADYKGVFPTSERELVLLPGVGSYTARAILAFAYNLPTSLIETNIRSVYLHHFFKGQTDVTDADILRVIAVTTSVLNPREWYYALMDYGVYLKKTHGNPNHQSSQYAKQSAFKGSDREIRGVIIRHLVQNPGFISKEKLKRALGTTLARDRIEIQLIQLVKEELVIEEKQKFSLPT
jgi:A/G-specific adenine glycosylase